MPATSELVIGRRRPGRQRPGRVLAWCVAAGCLVAGCLTAGCSSAGTIHPERHTLPFDGLSRTFYTYRPAGVTGPGPVVVLLPGFQEQATAIPVVSGLATEADRDRFTVVAPEAVQGSWNAGTCCGQAALNHVDDVGFLTALIADLRTARIADPARVYLAGFSNGAMMTYAFACARPDLLAGAAVVAGTLTSPCAAHRPLDLLVVHQTADPIVPYGGSAKPLAVLDPTGPFPSVATALETWLSTEGCGHQALPSAPPLHQLARAVLSCPGPTITELEIAGGGSHSWPQAPPLDATTSLVRFFSLGRN